MNLFASNIDVKSVKYERMNTEKCRIRVLMSLGLIAGLLISANSGAAQFKCDWMPKSADKIERITKKVTEKVTELAKKDNYFPPSRTSTYAAAVINSMKHHEGQAVLISENAHEYAKLQCILDRDGNVQTIEVTKKNYDLGADFDNLFFGIKPEERIGLFHQINSSGHAIYKAVPPDGSAWGQESWPKVYESYYKTHKRRELCYSFDETRLGWHWHWLDNSRGDDYNECESLQSELQGGGQTFINGPGPVAGIDTGELEKTESMRTFLEVVAAINNNYIGRIDLDTLVDNAIRGALSSLDSRSFWILESTQGEENKGDIGVQVDRKDGILTIIYVNSNSTARKAGVLAGDRIIKINDRFVGNMNVWDATSELQGAPQTAVKLTLLREPLDIKEYTVNREETRVVEHHLFEPGIGYIKINRFEDETFAETKAAIDALTKEKITGLILDLRGNPGGLLKSGIDIASEFLPYDRLVIVVKNNKTNINTEYRAYRTSVGSDLPMVILVDRGSAGTSEAVAGALQDWDRATIVGEHTLGALNVATVVPIGLHSQKLKLTVGKMYTPKGTSISDEGILPDIQLPAFRGDPQLEKAKELITTGKAKDGIK